MSIRCRVRSSLVFEQNSRKSTRIQDSSLSCLSCLSCLPCILVRLRKARHMQKSRKEPIPPWQVQPRSLCLRKHLSSRIRYRSSGYTLRALPISAMCTTPSILLTDKSKSSPDSLCRNFIIGTFAFRIACIWSAQPGRSITFSSFSNIVRSEPSLHSTTMSMSALGRQSRLMYEPKEWTVHSRSSPSLKASLTSCNTLVLLWCSSQEGSRYLQNAIIQLWSLTALELTAFNFQEYQGAISFWVASLLYLSSSFLNSRKASPLRFLTVPDSSTTSSAVRFISTLLIVDSGIMKRFALLSVLGFLCGYLLLSLAHHSPSEVHSWQLEDEVLLYRDQVGIPHIVARQESDLFYAMGWAQAEDRLLNILFKKHLLRGQLASILGGQALQMDLFVRNLNVGKHADKSLQVLTVKELSVLQSYVRGINDYAAQTLVYPLQFYLLGLSWNNYTVQDVSLLSKFVGMMVQYDWLYELARQKLRIALGSDLADQIFPFSSDKQFEQTTILKENELKQAGLFEQYNLSKEVEEMKLNNIKLDGLTMAMLQKAHPVFPKPVGSNAFVISGSKTKDGHPILANDPHLASVRPSMLYPVELILKRQNKEDLVLFGTYFSGLPLFVTGVKKNLAWGVTTEYTDNSDLYYEEVRGDQFLNGTEWQPLQVEEQLVKVRWGEDVKLRVRSNNRGPLLEHYFAKMLPKYNSPQISGALFSLGSTAYRVQKDWSLKMIYKTVFDQEENIVDSAGYFNSPNLVLAYINAAGDIGFVSTGLIPKKKYPLSGCFVKNGSSFNLEYTSGQIQSISFRPALTNPDKGYIVMANNKFAPDNLKEHPSLCQLSNGRAHSLEQTITSRRGPISMEDAKQMQLDYKDTYVQSIKEAMARYVDKELGMVSLAKRLISWDSKFTSQSKIATFFSYFERDFKASLLPQLPEEDRAFFINHVSIDHVLFRLLQRMFQAGYEQTKNDRTLCGNISCRTVLNNALQSAKLQFQQKGKSWGEQHTQNFKHSVLGESPLGWLLNKKYPFGGNSRTPNVASYGSHYSGRGGYFDGVVAANFRLVTNLQQTYFTLSTGISEGMFSKHSSDMSEMFVKGKYMKYERGAVRAGWLRTTFRKAN